MRWWIGLIVVAGCGRPSLPSIDAAPSYVEVALVPATQNRDVDVLFVIEDSPGTLDAQINLENAFPALVATLSSLPDGLPSLHVGVVTSDLGTKGADDATPGPALGSGPGACAGLGKSGNLQTNGTTLVTGAFISDLKNTDGTRLTNYTGTLSNAFRAIASVGAGGCGFEQHIEAARRALDNNPANAGFLRANAGLAVILFGDEDDCSVAHSTLLGPDTATLGALQSFRCTRFGVTCDEGGATTDAMNQVGAKGQCHSNESARYLTDVQRYTAFFGGLKGDPRMVMVGAIVGDPTVTVELRTPPGGGLPLPALAHSCEYTPSATDTEVADPGVRIAQLAGSFRRNTVTSVCHQDLSPAVVAIARQIRGLTGDPCLARDIALPADCEVFDLGGVSETAIPMCAGAMTTKCFEIVSDPTCPGQGLKLSLSPLQSPDIVTSVRCRL